MDNKVCCNVTVEIDGKKANTAADGSFFISNITKGTKYANVYDSKGNKLCTKEILIDSPSETTIIEMVSSVN